MFISRSVKPVRRFPFLLSSLVIAAMEAALSPLFGIEIKTHGWDSLRLVTMFGGLIPMVWWLRCVEGRLLDAALPKWQLWPYVSTLVLACIYLALKFPHGFWALLLFVVLQIPTAFLRSKPATVETLFGGPSREDAEKPARTEKPTGRFTLMLIVVLFAILAVGLRPLEVGQWRVLDQIVYFIFLPFWIVSLESRLQVAGLPDWCFPPYAFILLITLGLPWEFKAIDNTTAFFLFVLLQVPTLYFRSKPATVEPLTQVRSQEEEAGTNSIS